jgi:hypothetical protein
MIFPEHSSVVSTLKLHKKMIQYSRWITFIFIKWFVCIAPMIIIWLYMNDLYNEYNIIFINILACLYISILIYLLIYIRNVFKLMSNDLFEFKRSCICNIFPETLTQYKSRLVINITPMNCYQIEIKILYNVKVFKSYLKRLIIIEFLWWLSVIIYIIQLLIN